jgi:hypothetical protein
MHFVSDPANKLYMQVIIFKQTQYSYIGQLQERTQNPLFTYEQHWTIEWSHRTVILPLFYMDHVILVTMHAVMKIIRALFSLRFNPYAAPRIIADDENGGGGVSGRFKRCR